MACRTLKSEPGAEMTQQNSTNCEFTRRGKCSCTLPCTQRGLDYLVLQLDILATTNIAIFPTLQELLHFLDHCVVVEAEILVNVLAGQ